MDSDFNWKKLFFGKIKRKLGWGFGILIFIIILLVILNYNINTSIEQDQITLKDIEAPLSIMVEQVIGYDAILTGSVHEALLHMEKNQNYDFEEHRKKYDDAGVALDNLLKFEAKNLIDKSTRNEIDRERTYKILNELDRVNLALVDLEIGAFDAMVAGDVEKARSLVVSSQYTGYKKELAELYNQWGIIEDKLAEEYRQKILDNSRKIQIVNVFLGILFIIIAVIVPFATSRAISNPIVELRKQAEEIEKGNFKARVQIKSGDEIEELGNSFNKTAEALENVDNERKQVDRAKTEFLSITSHELRSPMTPMRAQLQMLMEGYYGKLTKEQKESMDIVLRNTERLDRILLDFLEISRIEAARLKFNFIKTSLNKNISSVIEEMRGFMPEKKIVIETKVDKLPVIEVDPDRVMQVLRNLMNNAIKFTPDNGKIEVGAKVQGREILFYVKDSGVGIKEEEKSKIFEPFFQSGGMYQRKMGGTGLGLAICKGIIESQKGKIWFDSKEGKGTTFFFTVPFEPVKEMAPIRILFSAKVGIDEKVKKLFVDTLGPLGEMEFNEIKAKGITKENLVEYVNGLQQNQIVKDTEEFKNKILLLFEDKKEEVKEMKKEKRVNFDDLKSAGLVSGGENDS